MISIDVINRDLLVVLLQHRQVLAGLVELALFHPLVDVPVDEGALREHQVELLVQLVPGGLDGGGVGQHASGPLDPRQVPAGDDSRGLVVDPDFEPGGAPVDEPDVALGLHLRDRRVHVFGDDVAAVQKTASHVLAVARVALHHLVRRLEQLRRDLRHGHALVEGLVGRHDRRVRRQREVDARVRHQVGLVLGQVDVESAVEAQRRRDRRHHLADQPVQVDVVGPLDAELLAADVVDGLVVHHEGAVGVAQSGVRRQDGVVGLHDGGAHLGGRVDHELELALLAELLRQVLHQQRSEAGAGPAAERVEDEEALQAGALLGHLRQLVHHHAYHLLADGVVASRVVIGGVFLARDQLLRMVQLFVLASSHLVCMKAIG
jgi:hypothetical protein